MVVPNARCGCPLGGCCDPRDPRHTGEIPTLLPHRIGQGGRIGAVDIGCTLVGSGLSCNIDRIGHRCAATGHRERDDVGCLAWLPTGGTANVPQCISEDLLNVGFIGRCQL